MEDRDTYSAPKIWLNRMKRISEETKHREKGLWSQGQSFWDSCNNVPYRRVWPYILKQALPAKAVRMFSDTYRLIARLKTWIRVDESHVSSKHLDCYLIVFPFTCGLLISIGSQSLF
jgi:hypothetical protein